VALQFFKKTHRIRDEVWYEKVKLGFRDTAMSIKFSEKGIMGMERLHTAVEGVGGIKT